MKIAGFSKTSFVDYPGKIAAVIFTPHCNMRCDYCHNKHILSGYIPLIDEAEVFDHLEKRKGMISALVITGGEPTMQADLTEFIKKVKSLGLAVKLDTNGTDPKLIESLLDQNLLDYIAMDIKAPLEKYCEVAGTPIDIKAISSGIALIKDRAPAYEFRTTFAPELNPDDIIEITKLIGDGKAYFLQQYRPNPGGLPAHPPQVLRDVAKRIVESGGVCEIRG
ncbi:MAG TPA: anaerobic ribonucleoside-triphosphate reductase activating protein, partial [Oscillospiraceae bacterium]|nr:anaerobic ribonucleoside-triphosphate reductase activating protein [Oscillospiraceae bacterium]